MWTRIKQFFKTRSRSVLYGSIISLVILLLAVLLSTWQFGDEFNEKVKYGSKSDFAPSLLNGVLVKKELANLRPVAAMIENSTDARPQVGLVDADVVYEIVTEGGITRFMALFQQNLPVKAGPIRSARSYFISYLREYDGVYVHAGGSPNAMNDILGFNIKDYAHANDGTYWREPIAGIASEHTLFANIKDIFKNSVSQRVWDKTSDYDSWKFKDPEKTVTDGGKVTIKFSSPYFQVDWTHNKTSNTYSRILAGEKHLDRLTGKQIKAATVVVMQVGHSYGGTYADNGHEAEWIMRTIGSGIAWVFEDGKLTKGIWEKNQSTGRTRFYDGGGQEISLNRGKIWVEVIPQDGSVTRTLPKPKPTT